MLNYQGKARKVVTDAGARTWEEIKNALNDLTKSARMVEDVQAEMSTRNQKPSETVEKFGEAKQKLLKDLTQAFTSELAAGEAISRSVITINERQEIRVFESGLRNSKLQMMVILSKSTTLTDAITCATTFE